jgi:hypothetical protein
VVLLRILSWPSVQRLAKLGHLVLAQFRFHLGQVLRVFVLHRKILAKSANHAANGRPVIRRIPGSCSSSRHPNSYNSSRAASLIVGANTINEMSRCRIRSTC